MHSQGARLTIIIVAILSLTLSFVAAKSIETPEQEPYQKNQIDMERTGFDRGLLNDPRDLQLFRYLLTNEILNRQANSFLWDDGQRKRSYWKQCAFNAVSCFGKK